MNWSMSWTARTMFELMMLRDSPNYALLSREAVRKYAAILIAGTY